MTPQEVLAMCEKLPGEKWWAGDGTRNSLHNGAYQVIGNVPCETWPEMPGCCIASANINFEWAEDVGRFIAAARNHMPELARRIIELEAELAALKPQSFREFVSETAAEVATWPAEKRNVLGGVLADAELPTSPEEADAAAERSRLELSREEICRACYGYGFNRKTNIECPDCGGTGIECD